VGKKNFPEKRKEFGPEPVGGVGEKRRKGEGGDGVFADDPRKKEKKPSEKRRNVRRIPAGRKRKKKVQHIGAEKGTKKKGAFSRRGARHSREERCLTRRRRREVSKPTTKGKKFTL